MEALLAYVDPFIAAPISDSECDPTANGILTFISTFQFLALLTFLLMFWQCFHTLTKCFKGSVLILQQFLMVLILLWLHLVVSS